MPQPDGAGTEPAGAIEAPAAQPEHPDSPAAEAPDEPPVLEPEPVEPPVPEPEPVEPPAGEPAAGEERSAEPRPEEPGPVEPPPAEPVRTAAMEAPPAEPEQLAPSGVEQETAEPEEAEQLRPEPADPPVAEAEPAEPPVAEPEPAEPRTAEPEPAEPRAAQRPVTQPRVAQAGAAPVTRPVLFEDPVPSLRSRLLPGSVLGLTALVLAFAVGAAFSGAILYSYYEFKKDRTEKRVATYVQGFDQRFKDALANIEAESQNARAEIQKELEPLRKTRAEGQTLESLIKKLEPSTFFVSTLDEAGQPSVGSAFAVASDNQQTLLLASYSTVKAATRQPGPPVTVRKGNEEIRATLWTWHEDRDLALIVLARGRVPTLSFAGQQVRPGERVFVMSALGGSGGSVTQGFVADVSATGVQHDAAVGQAFQGGPLVNSEGGVLAVASRSYAPLGFSSDQVFFAPFVRAACERVLRCGGGAPAMGDQGVPTRR